MARHVNIPVFIPHLGCPNNCVFCNQRTISGVSEFRPEDFTRTVDGALSTVEEGAEVEIAFFGGSFTGIDRELMLGLLKEAKRYVDGGRVQSIRCSTRPDYIDSEIIDILKTYGVNTVELGLQSISEKVLEVTKRGHSFESEKTACRLIKEAGIELVGQMMIGLPASTLEDELDTARFILSVGATAVRIYPTVVFRDTELAALTETGKYTPLTLDEAVFRSKEVLKVFLDSGITILRIGLCSSENLRGEETYLAGPNHAALGELIEGEVYYDAMREIVLKPEDNLGQITIFAPKGETSKVIGHKGINKKRLVNEFGIRSFKVLEDPELPKYRIRI